MDAEPEGRMSTEDHTNAVWSLFNSGGRMYADDFVDEWGVDIFYDLQFLKYVRRDNRGLVWITPAGRTFCNDDANPLCGGLPSAS